MLQQFLLVAGAHFLALLSPGPDFFLILRYAIARGRAQATLVCIGITLANALFILLAWYGLMALEEQSALMLYVQLAGCAFLLYMGWLFIRHAGQRPLAVAQPQNNAPASYLGALLAGLGSGLLNPKNALFYASLFAVLNSQSTPWAIQGLYGLWMISLVLGWDLLVMRLASQPHLIQRFEYYLPLIERLAGVLLILMAIAMLTSLLQG
tara:strand:+ start:16303 stop:16929 length:627 start_codon:yes stop_codon:yes gene_type:complete